MKVLVFFLGVLLGLGLTDLALHPSVPASSAVSSSRVSPTEVARSPDRVVATASALAPVAPPQPARAHPTAFVLSSLYGFDTGRLTAEEIADPLFQELLERAVRAAARDRLGPLVVVLGLDSAQREALLDAACDQVRAWGRFDYQSATTAQREACRAELSRETERQLAGALTPQQMETLAASKLFAFGALTTMDSFAAHGAPLPSEKIRELLVSRVVNSPRGRFVTADVPPLDPALPWLNEGQRRYAAAQQRWLEAQKATDAARDTRVKDPALRDMWPPE